MLIGGKGVRCIEDIPLSPPVSKNSDSESRNETALVDEELLPLSVVAPIVLV